MIHRSLCRRRLASRGALFALLLCVAAPSAQAAPWSGVVDPARAARTVAILTLVGFINVPIVKFSVDWWNSLHQPASVFRMDGPTIHGSMLWPLLVMGLAYSFLFLALHLVSIRAEIAARKIRQIHIAEIGER